MSATSGTASRTVIQRMQDNASGFELGQVPRIFRQLARKSGQRQPVTMVIRPIPRYFHHNILSVEAVRNGWRVECAAEALTGARGVLPHYLRDAALATEVEGGDSSMREFLELFDIPWLNRLGRAYTKYDLCALSELQGHDRNGAPSVHDLLMQLLPGSRKLTAQQRDVFRFVGLLGRRRRHLEGLHAMLADYFNFRVVVRAASVRRHMLDHDALVTIGCRGRNNHLGQGMPLGFGGYLDGWRVDVLLMPRSHKQLRESLDSAELGRAIKCMTRLYLGDRTPTAVFVMARRKFLPRPKLSSQNPHCQLGQSVCLAPDRSPNGVVRIRLRV